MSADSMIETFTTEHLMTLQGGGNVNRPPPPPTMSGYEDFDLKELDGFEGVCFELNFSDGELTFEITRDTYALVDDGVIQVTSHEVTDDDDDEPIIVVPLQRTGVSNYFRFQRNPTSGEYLVGFKPRSFLVMMHPPYGRDLRTFICVGSDFAAGRDSEPILRYMRTFSGMEGLVIDFEKRDAKLQ